MMEKSLVFIVVLFILVSLVLFYIPNKVGTVDNKISRAKIDVELIQKAIGKFYLDKGRYPSTEEGLGILVKTKNSQGKTYLHRTVLDPWGEPYEYRFPGIYNKESYDLWTYASDKTPGGHGGDADIVNWQN